MFDFFISYKQRDSLSFATAVASELTSRQATIWLDQTELNPGESLLAGIEKGITNSIDAITILSKNYFGGWSEQERRALYNLMVSGRLRIIPLYFGIDHEFIQKNAPLFSDIVAIEVNEDWRQNTGQLCNKILLKFDPSQRRQRLFEMFFRCVSLSHPDDQDLKLWLSLFSNDLEGLKSACDAGGDVNITDTALYNRYAREAALGGCLEEWRKLYLYLTQQK